MQHCLRVKSDGEHRSSEWGHCEDFQGGVSEEDGVQKTANGGSTGRDKKIKFTEISPPPIHTAKGLVIQSDQGDRWAVWASVVRGVGENPLRAG